MKERVHEFFEPHHQSPLNRELLYKEHPEVRRFFETFEGLTVSTNSGKEISLYIDPANPGGKDTKRGQAESLIPWVIQFDGYQTSSASKNESNYVSLSASPSQKKISINGFFLDNEELKRQGIFEKILQHIAEHLPDNYKLQFDLIVTRSQGVLTSLKRDFKKGVISKEQVSEKLLRLANLSGLTGLGFNEFDLYWKGEGIEPQITIAKNSKLAQPSASFKFK